MSAKQKVISEKLLTSLQKCRIHFQRLQYAESQTQNLFPLTLERYQTIGDAEIGHIDQLIYRFTKLQDELGTKTFRLLLDFLQEDVNDKPFRDILNMLERLKIIDSSDTWLELRELRNDLAHEYPLMMDETTDKLNHLVLQIPLLENILSTIEHVAKY